MDNTNDAMEILLDEIVVPFLEKVMGEWYG